MRNDSGVAYSRTVVEQLVEGKYSLMAMAHIKVVVISESRGDRAVEEIWGCSCEWVNSQHHSGCRVKETREVGLLSADNLE